MIWCLKLVVDCNAAVERKLSLMQYRLLCAGVIRVSFRRTTGELCVCVCVKLIDNDKNWACRVIF